MKKTTNILIVCLILLFALTSFSIYAESGLDEETAQRIDNPSDVYELLDSFKMLEGEWLVERDGEVREEVKFIYNYLGSETIQGRETEKISLEIIDQNRNSNLMYFWLGDEEIQQIEIEGQIIPKQMADMMTDDLLETVFSPFTFFSRSQIDQISQFGEVNRLSQNIGGNDLDIIRVRSDDLSEYELESAEIKLADFEDFLIVVFYEYQSLDIDEKAQFEVTDLELR